MPGFHTLESYDAELDRLRSTLSEMAGLAEAQLGNAISALVSRDVEFAERVVEADARIDRMEIAAEAQTVEIIARRSPLADDLRELVAAIKIAGALERIGDYAKNIAKRTTVMVRNMPLRQVGVLPEMAAEARRMIVDVIDAFIARDSARALDVWSRDERVDMLYDSLFREMLTHMMEKPGLITACTHLLFIAKNIERVGDQATNIAELAFYVAEGRPLRESRPKGDDTAFAVAPAARDGAPGRGSQDKDDREGS